MNILQIFEVTYLRPKSVPRLPLSSLQMAPKIVLAIVQNALIFHPKWTRFFQNCPYLLPKSPPSFAQTAFALEPTLHPIRKLSSYTVWMWEFIKCI